MGEVAAAGEVAEMEAGAAAEAEATEGAAAEGGAKDGVEGGAGGGEESAEEEEGRQGGGATGVLVVVETAPVEVSDGMFMFSSCRWILVATFCVFGGLWCVTRIYLSSGNRSWRARSCRRCTGRHVPLLPGEDPKVNSWGRKMILATYVRMHAVSFPPANLTGFVCRVCVKGWHASVLRVRHHELGVCNTPLASSELFCALMDFVTGCLDTYARTDHGRGLLVPVAHGRNQGGVSGPSARRGLLLRVVATVTTVTARKKHCNGQKTRTQRRGTSSTDNIVCANAKSQGGERNGGLGEKSGARAPSTHGSGGWVAHTRGWVHCAAFSCFLL